MADVHIRGIMAAKKDIIMKPPIINDNYNSADNILSLAAAKKTIHLFKLDGFA